MEAVKVTAGSVLSELMDKVSFANYLPTLMKATADNDVATPGYMLDEITDISFQPPPNCQQLTEYLSRRLEKPSACVKLKVLKIILYVMKNGNITFRQNLRRNDSSIKMATMFNGLADPLLGTSAYEMVRQKAQELLDVLYDPEVMQSEEESEQSQPPQTERLKLHMGGLGAGTISPQGKYQGFGSSPRDKEETVKDKVLDMLDNFINPADETANAIQSAFTSSPGNYEAIELAGVEEYEPEKLSIISQVKSHVPGKAGGGWESEEDELLEQSSLRRYSYAASSESIEKIDSSMFEDDSAEKQTVDAFCQVDKWPVSLSLLNETVQKLSSLNCTLVMKTIANRLQQSTYSDISKMRALLIVECFLRKDYVSLPTLIQHVSRPIDSIVASDASTHSLQTKARKIRLIMDKLTCMVSG